ncbi:MAG: outer membrane protein assembly factor BamA [Candidatus Muproteobacteria bacterium RBG_19FT_COMBO_61_10]|uniref:Outer membrane protein assembly factor BamA n=1 Tax=Candidatus Muproteobacteria bacterium RBG_19FT_COMBO_61_10 TaxID=1817761 RepID=A0A1F6UNX4_9PROT|nr:MAG: outer membrane protein assembly factor BamA [Candidatus Muproteobacteria bacterium RBG_19FT_COMBO_61_10]
MKKLLAALFVCVLSAPLAHAIETFTIADIRVEGLQRISAGTVFNYLPVKVGDTLTEDSARDAIRALFKTGFFKDVQLERAGAVLVVKVLERPSIDSIKITGTKDLEEDALKKGLKEVGLAEGRVLDSSVLDKTEQELKRQYFSRGRYAVKVKTTVTPLERNRVAILIEVAEGVVTKISQIALVGNKAYSDKQLLDVFKLSPSTLFSFMTKNDQYSKQQLAGDLESLRSYYQNRGFLEFAIDSTQVSITPDKQRIYLTVNIAEGKKFSVAGVKLAGKLILEEAELRKLIGAKPGDVFSRQEVTESSKRISDRLGDEGYAFANVNAVPDIDRDKNTVVFTFFVDPGQRVYVRRINIYGNMSTNDEVLRREMRQLEGAWFSTSKVQRSRERLQRLGYFDDVNIETPAVSGTADQVDINVTVKERLVNNFLAGVGYSDVDGLLLNANVTLKNLFGTGKELSTSVDTSKSNKHFNISYLNPYYTQEGISRSLNLYSSRVDAAAANTAAYNSATLGAGVLYGIPIGEDRTVSLGLAYESLTLDVTPGISSQIANDFVNKYGDKNSSFKGTLGWAYDTLDNPIFPGRGTVHRVFGEIAVPGSDLEYYKLTYTAAHYRPISKNITFKIKTDLGYGDSYGSTTTELPFYKNFFAGGSSSVRGYRSRTLGPKDLGGPDPTLPVGGSSRVLGNMEVLFPVPGASEDNKTMRLSVFVDTGMVYGPGENVDLGELRYSTGLAFSWYSPVGPLSISFARPLNAETDDREESVQFTLGTPFR